MITIRKFRKGDEVRMRKIAPRAFGVYARYGIDHTLPRDKVDECYRREVDGYVERIRGRDEGLEILVAEQDGRVAGYIVVGTNEHASRVFEFRWGSIVSLAVDPNLHGQGIGSRLIAKGLAWLKRSGVRYAQVSTDQNNIAAIRAYEKNGFRVIYSGITLSQYLAREDSQEVCPS